MKKKALVALVVIVVLVGTVSMITSVERSKARKALAAYKARLRAQGEKLTFEEAGYPFPLETNANLESFVRIVDLLQAKSQIPMVMEFMPFESPGRATVIWAGGRLKPPVPKAKEPDWPSWEELSADMASAAELLDELRAELEHPPRRFGWDYTNVFNSTVRSPFVHQRKAAQWLAADCLSALHDRHLPRAQADLHALTQLAQVYREDVTLISAMMRVAISGLGLAVTWEALPAEGWDEAGLLKLQHDWEAVDLVGALELSTAGGRMHGEQMFKYAREGGLKKQQGVLPFYTPVSPGAPSLKEQIIGRSITAYWSGHMDEDELFYLRHNQERLELLRSWHGKAAATVLLGKIEGQSRELNQKSASRVGQYRYLVSSLAIPNFTRAFTTTVRIETQRRLTITAIALKRFQLRSGRYPAALNELTPQFIAAELVDPWSGRPFGYRLNADGTFTLYSDGEDGRDDGGDPTPAKSTNAPPDMWTGKDAVWPAPVFPATP